MLAKLGHLLDRLNAGRAVYWILLTVAFLNVFWGIQEQMSGNDTGFTAHVASFIGLLALAQITRLSENLYRQSQITKQQGKMILNLVGLDSDENGKIHRIQDQREHERKQKVEPEHDSSPCVCCCESCSVAPVNGST